MIKTPRTAKSKPGSSRNISHQLADLFGKKSIAGEAQSKMFLSPKVFSKANLELQVQDGSERTPNSNQSMIVRSLISPEAAK